jgi:glycosyltransferase involved in cell wall biosynthesis
MDYYDFGLAGDLARSGVDVVVNTSDETGIPTDAQFSVRHNYLGVFGGAPLLLRGFRFIVGTVWSLCSAVFEGRRIVHFHFFHVGIMEAFNVGLARIVRRRVVITSHDVESFANDLEVRSLRRWVYGGADRVIAHNATIRDQLVERMHLDKAKIAIIPHGNYIGGTRPLPGKNEARARLGISPSSKVILFFGQIKDVKGLDLLIDAMPLVSSKQPDAVLLIAGRPWKSDFSQYDDRITRAGVRQRCITHIRYIPDNVVPLYYGAADVVVLPYRRIYQSGVVLMAMSYAKPVLVSDLPGMTDIVNNGTNGIVFRRDDPVDLAKCLVAMLDDEAFTQSIGQAGYNYVRAKHDWGLIGAATAELYSEILP